MNYWNYCPVRRSAFQAVELRTSAEGGEGDYWRNHGRIHTSRKESVPVAESRTARRRHTAMSSRTPAKMLPCELPGPAGALLSRVLYPMAVIIAKSPEIGADRRERRRPGANGCARCEQLPTIRAPRLRRLPTIQILQIIHGATYVCPAIELAAFQAVKLAAFDAIELLAEDPAHGAARRQRSRRAETVADRRNVAALGRTAAHGAHGCRRYAPHGCGDCRQFRYFK